MQVVSTLFLCLFVMATPVDSGNCRKCGGFKMDMVLASSVSESDRARYESEIMSEVDGDFLRQPTCPGTTSACTNGEYCFGFSVDTTAKTTEIIKKLFQKGTWDGCLLDNLEGLTTLYGIGTTGDTESAICEKLKSQLCSLVKDKYADPGIARQTCSFTCGKGASSVKAKVTTWVVGINNSQLKSASAERIRRTLIDEVDVDYYEAELNDACAELPGFLQAEVIGAYENEDGTFTLEAKLYFAEGFTVSKPDLESAVQSFVDDDANAIDFDIKKSTGDTRIGVTLAAAISSFLITFLMM